MAILRIFNWIGFEWEQRIENQEFDNEQNFIPAFIQSFLPINCIDELVLKNNEGSVQRNQLWKICKLNKDYGRQIDILQIHKILLNVVYPPTKIDGKYEPKLGRTGLYYCGRRVMQGHNFPDDDICDGIWGPDSGPNWPACRTLQTDKIDELNAAGKVQGYSGMVYCGKAIEVRGEGHDGVWGPDNGPPWDEWLSCIYSEAESIYYNLKVYANSTWSIF